MKKVLLVFCTMVLCFSCNIGIDDKETETLRRQISSLEWELEGCKKSGRIVGTYLMHCVFFNWKEDISEDDSEDVSEDVSEDGTEDISEDNLEDISGDVIEDISEDKF